MIMTEQQRRWWFATHPEYSWSRAGARSGTHQKDDDEDEDTEKFSPEDVDAYVDEALRHERDNVAIALLKAVQFWFGTEFESKTPAEQYHLLWGDEESAWAGDQPADEADSRESHEEVSTSGWNTEATGGQTGGPSAQQRPTMSRPGRPRSSHKRRRYEGIRDWIHMSRLQRHVRDIIEDELERAGANYRDYQYTFFRDKFVAQRDSTFDPYQRDRDGRTNIERMQAGNAPYDRDGGYVVLHHARQMRGGPLIEATTAEHIAIGRRTDPSEIDRGESRNFRESYWQARAKEFLSR